MSNPGDQLANGRHFLALQQLLLRAAKIFVSAAGFLIELHLFDGGCQLAADRDQQVLIVAGVVAILLARNTHDADGLVLAPKHNPDPVRKATGTDKFHNSWRQVGKKILSYHLGSRTHYEVA